MYWVPWAIWGPWWPKLIKWAFDTQQISHLVGVIKWRQRTITKQYVLHDIRSAHTENKRASLGFQMGTAPNIAVTA